METSLSKARLGYLTCGFVNSKNRMGGYVGATAFVVVMDEDAVKYVDIGGLTDAACAKSVRYLPAAPKEMLATSSDSAAVPSIADELKKLAELRDKGILTEAEFEAQKTKLLGPR